MNTHNDKDLRDFFSHAFEELEGEPQEAAWEQIAARITPAPPRRKPYLSFILIPLLIGAIGLGYVCLYPTHTSTPLPSSQLEVAPKPAVVQTPPANNPISLQPNCPQPTHKAVAQSVIKPPTYIAQGTVYLPTASPYKTSLPPQTDTPISLPSNPIADAAPTTKPPLHPPSKGGLSRVKTVVPVLPTITPSPQLSLPPLPIGLADTISKRAKRFRLKPFAIASLNLNATYALMEEQYHADFALRNFRTLKSWDTHRFRPSPSIGAYLPLSAHQSIGFIATWIPVYRQIEFEKENKHVYEVVMRTNGEWYLQRSKEHFRDVENVQLLQFHLAYRYDFSGKFLPHSAATVGLGLSHALKHKTWGYGLRAEFDKNLSTHWQLKLNSHYQLSSFLDAGGMLKTRLYGLGVGMGYKF